MSKAVVNIIFAYAFLRGAWHGARGRTKLIRNDKFGIFAYGDGYHDDTAYVQRVIDTGGGFFPSGVYQITSTIHINNSE